MGRYERRFWDGDASAMSRSDRRSAWVEAYIPDPLMGRTVPWSTDTSALLAQAEAAVAQLSHVEGAAQLGDLAPLLLRTEAAASSWIEGIPPRARQVAFAELALAEDLRSTSDAARLVARNILIMRAAVLDLAGAAAITVDDLDGLQRSLITTDRLGGLRRSQNWIGGSNPLVAAYVAPPPEHVGRLMEDLAGYLTSAAVSPLVQAGMAHAQLETIHPFPDGNGRVGRAVIHAVLARRGLTRGSILPISLVLMTRTDEYVAGLTAYRHVGPVDGAEAAVAANTWLQVFLRAVIDAADQVTTLSRDVDGIRSSWARRLADHRVRVGRRGTPRADSAIVRLTEGLLQAPMMTNRTAERLFGVSESAASAAFTELTAAGITTKRREGQTVVHFAPELMDLLDVAERRLASPAFDTSVEPPSRPAPTRGDDRREPRAQDDIGEERADWSPRAWSVWGKTDKGQGHVSLVRHLEDAAGVAGLLWDHWLPISVKRVISHGLPEGDSDGRILLTWLAGLHDIGKATPGFAIKASTVPGNQHLASAMVDLGLTFPPRTAGLPPHCHLGQYLLAQWLIERYGIGNYAATALATPVGMHHGTPPDAVELQSFRGSAWTGHRNDAWRDVQSEIINGMTRRLGMDLRLPDLVSTPPTQEAQVLLTAAVVVADWLASDIDRFPAGDHRSLDDRLDTAGLEDALRGPWSVPAGVSSAAELLELRFPRLAGRGIHPIQARVRDIAAQLTEPGLIVVEAPMGSGKTEAAFMAAEELARTFDAGGVFIALPTMATSDAMFARVREWTRHLAGPDAPTMFLAHGKARLNEDYAVLVREARVAGINDAEAETLGDQADAQATVTSWLQGRRKGVLANLVVGTIDQVLFGALKTRHLALRHLALAGKVVIVDEVHAADHYMRRYLARALEWLGAYGSPVILLSATLPPSQLAELTAAYGRGRDAGRPPPLRRTAYPRITVQTRETVQTHVPWTGPVTDVGLLPVDSGLEALVTRVAADVAAGGCVVIIRNTVRSAQETYAALRGVVGADRIALLHSQFTAADRAVKERDLLSVLGPPGPGVERPHGYVVVGTQVLEQSLDIDADVMESDHAPVDLLLQRMGRLHRHERGPGQADRPATLRRAVLRVIGMPVVGESPVLDRGSEAVYGAWRLLTSAAVLAPHASGVPVRLPNDISRLIEQGYDDAPPAPAGWEQEWVDAEEGDIAATKRAVGRAKPFRVDGPRGGPDPTLVGWLDGRAGDAKQSDEVIAGRAQVRDSEDSLEVLVVWRDEDGVTRVLPGPHEYSGAALGVTQQSSPTSPLALSVLGSSVRLPSRITGRGRIDAVITELEVVGWEFSGWRQSQWLAGELVLVLDKDLRATLDGQELRYDLDLGLVIGEQVRADE